MALLKSHRFWVFGVLALVLLALEWVIQPAAGKILSLDPRTAGTLEWLHSMLKPLVIAGLVYLLAKTLIVGRSKDAWAMIQQGNQAAGTAYLGQCILLGLLAIALIGLSSKAAIGAELPPGAYTYGPLLKAEQLKIWPGHPMPSMLAGLVEQESCPSLHSKMCWSPTAQLKTSREEGAGFSQTTRAYNPDGSLRFDKLAEMRRAHPELREWSWANIYQRADLQLLALVFLAKENYQIFAGLEAEETAKLDFADAAHNGGAGGVQHERRVCGLTANCDPNVWVANVERVCLKSHKPIYGNKSACDINREHVHNVRLVRSPKYRALMGDA